MSARRSTYGAGATQLSPSERGDGAPIAGKGRNFYPQAAEQGYWPAVPAYLAMQQGPARQHSTEALFNWLQQLAVTQQLSAAAADPTKQQQLQQLQAELGAWQLLPAAQQQQLQQPYLQQFQTVSACALTLQPVLSTLASARDWLGLMRQWQQDPQFSQLAICFKPPQFLDSRDLACSEQAGVRDPLSSQRFSAGGAARRSDAIGCRGRAGACQL